MRTALLAMAIAVGLIIPAAAQDADPIQEARTLLAQGEIKDSLRWLKKFTRQHPGHAPGWQLMGDACVALGKDKRAEAAYREALRLAPHDEALQLSLGRTLLRLDERGPAIALFKRMTLLNPDNVDARFELGVAYNRNFMFEDAFEQYKRLRPVAPDLAQQLYDIIFMQQ